MSIYLKQITIDTPLYFWAIDLLSVSFPVEERRDGDLQRKIMKHPDYRLMAIADGDTAVGVAGYFDAPQFVYFENFCILPDKRNGGYGSETLKLLTDGLNKPFILEAEPPANELTRRRIAFYKRNGMKENPYPHIQPHYRKDDPDLPLVILSYGKVITQRQYDEFRRYLDINVDVKNNRR